MMLTKIRMARFCRLASFGLGFCRLMLDSEGLTWRPEAHAASPRAVGFSHGLVLGCALTRWQPDNECLTAGLKGRWWSHFRFRISSGVAGTPSLGRSWGNPLERSCESISCRHCIAAKSCNKRQVHHSTSRGACELGVPLGRCFREYLYPLGRQWDPRGVASRAH